MRIVMSVWRTEKTLVRSARIEKRGHEALANLQLSDDAPGVNGKTILDAITQTLCWANVNLDS